ncbi:MAG: hypothetical protein JSR99_03515 [Proteobacteria bacterium]|nr:hypothetical protein [Pseudomonadota bacterium]
MTPEQHINAYLAEWLDGLIIEDLPKDELVERMANMVPLDGELGMNNYVSRKGYHHLCLAADLLLRRRREQRCLSQRSARKCLIESHFKHLEKVRQTGTLSEFAVVAGADKRIAELERDDGLYVLPLVFAPRAKESCFQVGPVTLMSKDCFKAQHGDAIRQRTDGLAHDRKFVAEWRAYSGRYDHFIAVAVEKHEAKMAWAVAREAADYMLNLIRMTFGYTSTRNIKIGGGHVQEQFHSTIMISKSGNVLFSSQSGPWGSHFDDRWMDRLDKELGASARLLSNFGSWITSGKDPGSPVLERLLYANSLLSGAYSEPHDHIRLVRLISALEALALVPPKQKAESLARRCSQVASSGDTTLRDSIFAAIIEAYRQRSAVVHGDAPSVTAVMEAFLGLERHILAIYMGFLELHARVYNKTRPQSIKHFRRAVGDFIED